MAATARATDAVAAGGAAAVAAPEPEPTPGRATPTDAPTARPGHAPGRVDPRPCTASPLISAASSSLRSIFARFWPLTRPYRGRIAAGLVLLALVPALEALQIWLFKVVVDEVIVPLARVTA